MTLEALKEALVTIDNYFGKALSKEERTARAKVYTAALAKVPDEVAIPALYQALTVCRFQNQLLVDWCDIIRKMQGGEAVSPDVLWEQMNRAARLIRRDCEWAAYGGVYTNAGKISPTELLKKAQETFNALPDEVQKWAGSYRGMLDMLARPQAELVQYVKPGFVKTVEAVRAETALGALPLCSGEGMAPRLSTRPAGEAKDFLALGGRKRGLK